MDCRAGLVQVDTRARTEVIKSLEDSIVASMGASLVVASMASMVGFDGGVVGLG